jgi:O-succinylbenzoic acid--CoA ligase
MGDTALVAVRLPNSKLARELVRAWDQGLAVLPVDPALPEAEVGRILEELRPARLIDSEGRHDLVGGISVSDDVALVVTTSGTSGPPKGVELSHGALERSARAVMAGLEADPGQRWLCCLPMSRIAGLAILVRSRICGTVPVIHDRFDEGLIAAERSTSLISLVPTTLGRLLDARVDLSSYSAVLVGGAAIPPTILDRARDAGARVVTTYGMTETCGGCVHDGWPLRGVEIATESDRILIRGPMLMNGYRLQPELSAEALVEGWLRTSDRGVVDENGKLRVLGRLDDVIITGGVKVSPTEVERLLCAHPHVADAAVLGVPDVEWGQAVAALVVPAGGQRPSLDELRSFIAARAGSHQAPKSMQLVREIPRDSGGKVQRRQALAQLFAR